jgi:hypothetical protein
MAHSWNPQPVLHCSSYKALGFGVDHSLRCGVLMARPVRCASFPRTGGILCSNGATTGRSSFGRRRRRRRSETSWRRPARGRAGRCMRGRKGEFHDSGVRKDAGPQIARIPQVWRSEPQIARIAQMWGGGPRIARSARMGRWGPTGGADGVVGTADCTDCADGEGRKGAFVELGVRKDGEPKMATMGSGGRFGAVAGASCHPVNRMGWSHRVLWPTGWRLRTAGPAFTPNCGRGATGPPDRRLR